jgi:hypothetical protein
MSTVTPIEQKFSRLAWENHQITAVMPIVTAVGLFLTALALYGLIQWSTPAIVGNDGYYHIKIGYLMRQEGLTPDFEALPFTILNAGSYYDHHLLFHLYLALFAPVDPLMDGGATLTQGAKIATVILPSLAVMATWWLLREQQVPYATIWAIALFAVSEAFLYRMSMARAQSGALIFLVLALHWSLTGRYRWLAPLGFVFVWFYNAFPLLWVIAGVYIAAIWLLERHIPWQAIAYPTIGIALGLIINPYFPENLTFIAGHILPKVGESTVPVGNEWSPYRTWTLVQNSGFALAAFLMGVLAIGWRQERIDKASLVALGLVVVFGFALFKSRRFIEYFPPFSLIFLALTTAPIVREWFYRPTEYPSRFRLLVPLIAILFLAIPLRITIRDAQTLVANSKPADVYSDAMLWLRHEAPAGTTIFQTDWDDFTRQFFYLHDIRYINGLDPTFMQQYDESLYQEWVEITRGRVSQPGKVIRDQFDAQFVFSDLEHQAFLAKAAADPLLEEVYRDEYAVIYAVR